MGVLPLSLSMISLVFSMLALILLVIIVKRRGTAAKARRRGISWDEIKRRQQLPGPDLLDGIRPYNPKVPQNVPDPNRRVHTGSTPSYGKWDNLLMVGQIIKKFKESPDCFNECHNDDTCTHIEVKHGECILKNRSKTTTALALGEDVELPACNGDFKCADGWDEGRTLYLHPQSFDLDRKPTADEKVTKTNREAMEDFQKMFKSMHKTTNQPKWLKIFSMVLTVATVILGGIGAVFFTGMTAGATAFLGAELAIGAADAGLGTYLMVTDINLSKELGAKLKAWTDHPYQVPVSVYHNMPQDDKEKMMWAYECREAANLRSDECSSNGLDSGYGMGKAGPQKVHYWKETDEQGRKRRSICCKYYHDRGDWGSAGKCDDVYDPENDDCIQGGGSKYSKAINGTKELLNSSKWQFRREAEHNYSKTMLDMVKQYGYGIL